MWLVPVIPGTAAASVTGTVSKAIANHDKAVTLLYLGEHPHLPAFQGATAAAA
jgi:hypothetical protein